MKPADLVQPSLLAGPIDIQLLRDERLHELFEASAQRAPLAPAMSCAGQSVTYGELQSLTERWSRSLRARGVGPGSKVGVWLTRSIALHAAVLAVLKAGATYLPFDDQAPAERVATCLDDCAADLLLVDAAQASRAAGLAVEAVDVAALDYDVAAAPALRPPAQQAAYIIYTSGSTGRPKGVAVSHASICHLVRAENSLLGVTETDVVYAGFSAAFDMSLEEVFIAYLAGACLAVASAEQAQQIDRLPDMLTQAGVTVLHCVPTLLALVDRDVPGLRLINLGGEACPQALVESWWRPGRRLTNTYGPTEATVTATIAELRPGTPVTIGEPLPNYTILIVDENGRLAPAGASGELCIGGPGVSLGYVNRPLLTAAAFVPVPGSGDLAYPLMYRTGDRARIDEQGQIHLHGRLDSQVKHRGFRIELGEIEAELTRLPGVRTAAVVLRGNGADEHLAAYVVAAGFDQRALRIGLSERLPSYMVPAAFHLLDVLPRLPSGKVDRKALPDLPHRIDHTSDADDPLLAVLQSLFPHARAGLQDDFFRDLGGHSLLAAAFVSRVRKLPRFARLSLQDLYELRTAELLSARFAAEERQAATPDFLPVSRWKHALCTLAQAGLLPFIFAIASMEFLLPYIALDQTHDDSGWTFAIALALGVFIAIPPVTMAVAIAAKWLILGRVRPGRHPLWGSMFLRWWFVSRRRDIVVRTVLADTPLMAAYYRLLGARIGKGVHLGDVGAGAPDLVTIGAGATIGSRTLLNTATVAGGWLIFGPVSVGAGAQVGSACVLEPGSRIGDGGELGSLSCLGAGTAIPAGELWSGSPAAASGTAPAVTARPNRRATWRRLASIAAFALIALLLMPVLHLLPMLPSLFALDMAQEAGPVRRDLILIAPVIALAYTVLVLLEVTILRWLLLGRVTEGEHDTASLFYVRKWTVDRLLDLSLAVLHPIFATLYVVPFFRVLGARVGEGAEISTAASVTHDLLEVGEGAFIADSVKLGDQEIRHGKLTLRRTIVGRRTFVGNSAFVPSGAHLPDDALVGCLSVPPAPAPLQPGQACFGSPAIVLPSRQQSTCYDARLTFRPRRWAIAQRLVIEAIRILLPRGALFVAICFGLDYFDTLPDDLGLPLALLTVPLLYVVLFVAPSVLGVAALKWALVGRYRPAEYPLWSRHVWLSEAVTAIYEGLTVPLCLRHLRGTAFLPLALRLFGAKIGRRVWMESTELTEFDLVTIGDEAELNQDGGPQTHLFEDRVMKMDRLVLAARSTMGAYSIALPGAQLQEGARLGALSLVMKGETIPSGPAWTGSPARCQG